ncbi:MAG: ABC transporter ATP-binding protein [Desulfobacter sp.]|nr:MAG: ABC transporter ATP-binding protein [Desulfobacter sp.]
MALLSVKNLSVGYETKKGLVKAVDGISFDLEQGRPLGFVGESGCGKTTLGMALMGLLPDNGLLMGGSIEFGGRNLALLNENQWRSVRGKEVAMIFQAAMNALNPVYRVDEQIREAILAHEPDISDRDLNRRIRELFELVEIPLERSRDYPHEYSGGMKQRVVIAMALACSPRLIIADEPTTALDVIVQDQILKGLKAIQARIRTGLIFISHDIAVVASICDDICVMYGGQIVETGPAREVFSDPRHPYTRTLLGSYLSLDNADDIVVPKMQEMPDLTMKGRHCRFAVNCTACSPACTAALPQWIEITPTHRALCCQGGVIGRAGQEEAP